MSDSPRINFLLDAGLKQTSQTQSKKPVLVKHKTSRCLFVVAEEGKIILDCGRDRVEAPMPVVSNLKRMSSPWFMEECLKLASQFWLPPFTFQARVCGLYLLYGLYCTQPCQRKAKIRVTLDQWDEVMSFMLTVHSQHHLDVEFIFQKLSIMEAFHFVSTRTEMHPMNREVDGDAATNEATFQVEEKSDVSEVMSLDIIEQMSAIHNQYYKVKCALAGPNCRHPDRSLNVINPDSLLNITKLITKHEEKRRARRFGHSGHSRMAGDSSDQSESDPDSKMKVPESVGTKRRRIRDRAYGQLGWKMAAKSGGHVTSNKLGSTSDDSGSPVKKKRKGKVKTRMEKKSVAKKNKNSSVQAVSENHGNSDVEQAVREPFLGSCSEEGEVSGTAVLHMPKLTADEEMDQSANQVQSVHGPAFTSSSDGRSPAKRKRGCTQPNTNITGKRKKSGKKQKAKQKQEKPKAKTDSKKGRRKKVKT